MVASFALLFLLTAAGPVTLLDPGTYRKAQLPAAAAGRDWLALCRTDGGAELKTVKIEVHPVGGKPPAREVAVPACPYAVALLRSPALAAGKVETVADDQGAFTFRDRRYTVKRDAPEPEPDAACGVRRVHLVLASGETRQTLADADFCTVFTLRWIGDLDGDGKLDLLVAENLDSGATVLHLFLGGRAAAGAAVGPAATLRHGG